MGFHRIWHDSKGHKANIILFSEFRRNREDGEDSPGGYLPPEDIVFRIFSSTPGMIEPDGGSSHHKDSRKKYINALRLGLSLLPERKRDILFMKYYEGMENCEIARRVGISREAVRRSVACSVNSLRTFLIDGKAVRRRVSGVRKVGMVDEKDNKGKKVIKNKEK